MFLNFTQLGDKRTEKRTSLEPSTLTLHLVVSEGCFSDTLSSALVHLHSRAGGRALGWLWLQWTCLDVLEAPLRP